MRGFNARHWCANDKNRLHHMEINDMPDIVIMVEMPQQKIIFGALKKPRLAP